MTSRTSRRCGRANTRIDGTPLVVQDGLPDEGGEMADPPAETTAFAPAYHPEEIKEIADKLLKNV